MLDCRFSSACRCCFPGKNGKIAFILGPDVYMNPDGSDVKQLTNLGADSSAIWESWSPNGTQIVSNQFWPPDFIGQIWVMNADGSNQRLFFAEADFDDERQSFTPDGSLIAVGRFGRSTSPFGPKTDYSKRATPIDRVEVWRK